ncbi:MAG: twin-arginine translocase subunit TatC [Paludibacteraceae bacterium]|nr:twin-arginine translocase subunit TatC [Paludibacteraceae bacterium]
MERNDSDSLSFWDHLDALRSCLVRMLLVALGAAVVAFVAKQPLFDLVFYPNRADFPTYRLLSHLVAFEFSPVQLINTEITRQFTLHLQVAFVVGVCAAMPYLLWVLYGFIAPALYRSERRVVVRSVAWAYCCFCCGLLVSYFIVFPCAFLFLSAYQVSAEVINTITVASYLSLLSTLCLVMGILFQMPVVSALLAKWGLLSPELMRRYRRHAIVAVLILAAIITPTADVFTLLMVGLPVYLLYEISILAVARVAKSHSGE